MTTPSLQLETMFTLDRECRITSTREPGGSPGPLFCLIRGADACAWAVRADLPRQVADDLQGLAQLELPTTDFEEAPVRAADLLAVLGDRVAPNCHLASKQMRSDGPAFVFPDLLAQPADVVAVHDEAALRHNFGGWAPGEIAAGRSPVCAVLDGGRPVSICFCARSSPRAAEAGVETATAFRGRGFGPRVVAAWARAVRRSGRVPLYSTSWTNTDSLSVARKLGLVIYASDWSLYD